MLYSFNTNIAVEYGVEESIFLHNLCFWIAKNKANNKHFYEGKYWTYNSLEAFTELFPFWSQKQIRRIIKNLKDKGAIEVGNFNKAGYDRTQWYSVKVDIFNICLNGQIHLPERALPFAQMGTPIPDSKPYSNTYIYNSIFEKYKNENIINHKELTSKMKQAIDRALKKDNEDTILKAIERYGQAFRDKNYQFCKYKMTLDKFLTQNNGYTDWLDEGQKWINYSDFKNKNKAPDPDDIFNVNGR